MLVEKRVGENKRALRQVLIQFGFGIIAEDGHGSITPTLVAPKLAGRYPAGLIASGNRIDPPAVPPYSDDAVKAETIAGLSRFLPAVGNILDSGAKIQIGGGWVFALGNGSLSDAKATLHRRDQFGILRHGSYYSVDTGKYSTAPWLAARIADEIAGVRAAADE